MFHRAIKDKCPDIKLIAGPGVSYEGSSYEADKAWAEATGVDIFDEHMLPSTVVFQQRRPI